MKSSTLSRGPEIDVDKCVTNIGSRYSLVIIASARARELRRNNRNSERREHVFPIVTSLLEVQDGITGKDYLTKIAAQHAAKKQAK